MNIESVIANLGRSGRGIALAARGTGHRSATGIVACDRVELRLQRVEDLDAAESFPLAWRHG